MKPHPFINREEEDHIAQIRREGESELGFFPALQDTLEARSQLDKNLFRSLSRSLGRVLFPVNLDDEERTRTDASGDGEVDVNRATGTVESAQRNSKASSKCDIAFMS